MTGVIVLRPAFPGRGSPCPISNQSLPSCDSYPEVPAPSVLALAHSIPPAPHCSPSPAAPDTHRSTSNPGLEVLRRDYGEAPARTGTGSGAAGWTGLPQSVGAQTSRPRLPLGGRWKRGGRPNSTLRPQTTNRRYDVWAQDTSSNLCPRVLRNPMLEFR